MPEHAGVPRLLKNTSADMELQVYVAGVATAPDASPAPRVTITAEDGTVVVNDQVATISGTKAKYTLSVANTSAVKFLTAVWTVSVSGVTGQVFTTYAQVVGELLFTLVDARAAPTSLGASLYPDAVVVQMRDLITDAFSDVLGRSPGAHYGREVLNGDGTDEIELRESRIVDVISIKTRASGGTTWTALTSTELDDVLIEKGGRLTRETLGVFPSGRQNVAVEYEHGLSPIPYELKQAALRVAKHYLVKSDLEDRAISQTNEFGVMQLAIPAGRPGAWFGIPDVDAVLQRHRRKLPGIA